MNGCERICWPGFVEGPAGPPGRLRIERILGSGRALFEQQFTAGTVERLPSETAIDALERLIPPAGQDEVSTAGLLVELKSDSGGKASLNTILEEIDKLERVRRDRIACRSVRGLLGEAARGLASPGAGPAYPSDLRAMAAPIQLTLLAALCWSRTAEITDALVDLLIDVVDKIRVRAENRVEKALVAGDLKRVRGKHGLLFALASAAVDHPDETVRTALYPVVSEATLRQFVKEAKASEQMFRQRVRKEIRGSYSHHYRRMLPRILDALEFRCANSIYRPVMDALELLQGHVDTPGQQRFYPPGDRVPIGVVVPDQWREAVIDEHGRIERIPYELSVLRALRDALRRQGKSTCPGAGTGGATPTRICLSISSTNRDVHYAAIRQPRDASAFIADLQARLHAGLDRLDQAVRTNTAGGVRITTRRGRPWTVVPADRLAA